VNLRAGARLGAYEIVSSIGAGGMGEVYKARDTRLSRTVAIKILPVEFSGDARLKVRFEREAKTISALNHPHICTLHDVGSQDGTDYLVMEYCEGITLADRIARRKKIPIAEILEHGAQIADGLDRAHRQGIIHRDLKPSNVMLTKSGVKLLDFGLARQQQASPNSQSTSSVAQPHSEDGKIVGTLQYIAPETLTSGEADERSDIYALGLILYEMIHGAPAFAEQSRARLIAAILEHEPAPLTLSADVSPQLSHIVWRCLRKSPDERWRSAADIAAQLRWIASERLAEQTRVPHPRRRGLSAAVIAGVLIAAAAAYRWLPRSSAIPQTKRSAMSMMVDDAPLVFEADRLASAPMAISPDGQTIAYIAGGPPRLYVRSTAVAEGKPLTGTERAAYPFFSPDGSTIGFVSNRKLKKLSLAGGAPQVICETGGVFHRPSWGVDGRIYFRRGKAIYSVPSTGGIPVQITRPAAGEIHSNPAPIPGNKLLFDIYTSVDDINNRTVAVLDLASGTLSRILNGASQPRYSETGHLLFSRCGPANQRTATIFSADFDLKSGRVSGAPVPRISDVEAYPITGTGYWQAAADGTIVYVPHDSAFIERELIWLDRNGTATPVPNRLGYIADVRLSPDGMHVAFDDLTSVRVTDLHGNSLITIIEGDISAQTPIWSSDGRQVAFELHRPGEIGLYAAPLDGSTPPKLLVTSMGSLFPNSWSPDGKLLAYTRQPTASGDLWDIWGVDTATAKATQIVTLPGTKAEPAFSSDGRWLAFTLSHEGQYDIHVQKVADAGTHYVVAAGIPCDACQESNLRWSRDGRELFFRSFNKVMALDVSTGNGSVRAGTPRPLFEADLQSFDISSDGKRFIASRWRRHARWDHLNLVTGWWIQ
jgi:eukaryotic-like serine/threonine-protein kinase